MLSVLNVVAPVFALIALGYGAVRWHLFPKSGVSGLIVFVNNFATPCLLFRAMLTVDFQTAFNPAIIGSFYFGAAAAMAGGFVLARLVFHRPPGESVAFGFAAWFTNTVLVGIPIMQRAFGEDAMPVTYSIIGLHAPMLMTAGMLMMELARRDGGRISTALLVGVRKVIGNPLLIGIGLGLVGNLANITMFEPVDAFTAMLAAAVLPVALFGLGGALNDYRLADNWSPALAMTVLKLILHPAIAWVLMVPVLGLPMEIARYGIVLAAMPAGINAYVFSTFYNRGTDVAANTILLSTALSVISISFWLYVTSL